MTRFAAMLLVGCTQAPSAGPPDAAPLPPPASRMLTPREETLARVAVMQATAKRWTSTEPERSASCDRARACLRERLPPVYDPAAYERVRSDALGCLGNLDETGPCLPFAFATHQANQRPVELGVRDVSGSCTAVYDVSIVYTGLGYDACKCLGTIGRARRGGACEVLPGPGRPRFTGGIVRQRIRSPEDDLLRALGLFDRAPSEVDGLPLARLAQAHKQALHERLGHEVVRELVVTDEAQTSHRLVFKQMPPGWLTKVLAGVSAEAFARACPPRGKGDASLTLAVAGKATTVTFHDRCRVFAALERQLMQLDAPSTCDPPALPPAGLDCLPGLEQLDYVVLQRAGYALHALDAPLTNVLCASVRSSL